MSYYNVGGYFPQGPFKIDEVSNAGSARNHMPMFPRTPTTSYSFDTLAMLCFRYYDSLGS